MTCRLTFYVYAPCFVSRSPASAACWLAGVAAGVEKKIYRLEKNAPRRVFDKTSAYLCLCHDTPARAGNEVNRSLTQKRKSHAHTPLQGR